MADPDGFQPWFLTIRRLKHGGFTVGEPSGDESRVFAGFDTLDGALAYVRQAMQPANSVADEAREATKRQLLAASWST